MDEKLESIYNWFDLNRENLIKGHEGERVLIGDRKFLGYFSDQDSAVEYAKSIGLKLGEFLVQRCITQEDEMNMLYNVNIMAGFYG